MSPVILATLIASALANTTPTADEPGVFARVRGAAVASGSPVELLLHGAVTVGRGGERLAALGEMADAGAVGFSDDGSPVKSAVILRNALLYAGMLEIPLFEHAEDPTLTAGAEANEGYVATILGLKGWPVAGELAAVERAIAVLEAVLPDAPGARLHLTHLSTAGALEAVFRSHLEHAAQFVWACEAMTDPECPEPVRRRMTPSLLEKLPDTLTRPEFGPLRSRAKTLLDGGQAAVRLLLESATQQQAERFVSRMARISTLEPQRLRVLEQAAQQTRGATLEPQEQLLAATREAVAAKRLELKQLLEIEIPRTLQRIQTAAADGDLRENFEYHMLRDRQELQSARAATLQRDLGVVKIIDPGASETSQVNVGTVVRLIDPEGAQLEPITILGPWDADPARRIYASGSDLARGLLGRRVGDDVELQGRRAIIREITAWGGER